MLNQEKLDKSTPIPLYFQLKKLIVGEIKNGNYKIGDLIPTEFELSELFQISRTTIRQAINELVQEGWLYRVKSKGTFVTKPKINQDFIQTIRSFNSEILSSGHTPSTAVLDMKITDPPEKVRHELNLDDSAKAIFIHRKRYADEEPIVMVKTFLPYDRCGFVLEHDFVKESLYSVLSTNNNTRIYKIRRLVEAVDANSYDMHQLNIKRGRAIQQFISTGYNVFNEPIEYSIAHYRGDRNSFEVYVAPGV